jgi:predicted dehydrogenase
VIVVGAGIRGSMFARAIDQNPLAELVAICEPNAAVRDEVAGALQVRGYADVHEALRAHPEATAAIIATPDFAHREASIACASAGLDLLLEKPLATTSEDAAAICDAVEQAGTRAYVGFENRWNDKFAEVRRQLASGRHGTMVTQVVNLNDTLFVPTEMLSWAAQSSPAWFLMPHSLDLAMWLSGARPVTVFARGVRRVLPRLGVDTWDAVTASFSMSDGSVLVLNSQWVLPASAPSVFDFRYEAHTDTTSYRIDIADTGVTRYGPDRVDWLQFGVTESRGRLNGIPIAMVDDFVDALSGRDADLPDARHGQVVTDAIEAVHQSLATSTPVAVPTATSSSLTH